MEIERKYLVKQLPKAIVLGPANCTGVFMYQTNHSDPPKK